MDRGGENNGGAWENRRDGADQTDGEKHNRQKPPEQFHAKTLKRAGLKRLPPFCHVERSETSLTISLGRMSIREPEILRFAQNDKEHISVQRFTRHRFNEAFDPLHAKSIVNCRTKITNRGFTYATCCWNQSTRFHLSTKTADGPKQIRLSENFGKGNTLLLFFPMAFTATCTTEMCEVSAGLNGYTSLNAVVYGISGDNPFAQEAWAQKEKITVPLLATMNTRSRRNMA
jgi:hypothetical protein